MLPYSAKLIDEVHAPDCWAHVYIGFYYQSDSMEELIKPAVSRRIWFLRPRHRMQ